ncbi:MAG: ABC transporter substrate-binding protein [Cyclobacteriaceae bacterium]
MKYILFCLLLLSQTLFGQDYQTSYLAGKSYLANENYQLAQQSFQKVINDDPENPFRNYGAFYYGIASYRLEQLSVAKDIWRQIEVKDSRWKNIDEVYYWLARVNLESDQLGLALPYVEKATDTTIVKSITAMVETGLQEVEDLELLSEWYGQYPENRPVAERYAQVLLSTPLTQTNNEIIAEINEKFSLANELQVVKKDVYKVAVLLPFMYQSLDDMSMIVRNTFITDLYAGMVLAAEHLKSQGIEIELLPYDTRRSKPETAKILAREEMKGMDLIVGPLYPAPFELVNQFSRENRINMFNPLSGNGEIIAENPFSFLLKPTYETMAKVAADYAQSTYINDEDLIILYEDEDRFASMASVYDSVMTKAGYNVVQRLKLSKENSREILDALTSSREIIVSREERDSLLLLPYRRISDRQPTEQERRDPNIPTDSLLYFEDRYDLGIDSIGHIFVASTNSLIAANAVGGVEVRGDRIPIVGLGEWLNFNVLTLEQFERLEVALIHTNYVNYDSTGVYAVEEQLTQLYRNQPSINQLTGYDLIWFVGQQLFEHGVYFQIGLRDGEIVPGRIFPGYRYGFARDNQLVPIVKMVDSALKIVNSPNE